MSIASLSVPALGLLLFASITVLVIRDWRWSIAALSLQYLGGFLLVATVWPANLAVVKLVAGWMSGSVLGMTLLSANPSEAGAAQIWPTERLFRVLAASLVVLVMFSLAPRTVEWIPGMGLYLASGGFLLMGMGLLHLGLSVQPLRVVLGLLTVLSGFEILYAAIEASALVAGLLAIVNLGIALVGAYLMSRSPEEQAG
ncbi:MAG: hypothetical protein OEZ02_10045 [Anaerolineae bacterium]|nr:hypothetical protein [Anaerolineae bacterium]